MGKNRGSTDKMKVIVGWLKSEYFTFLFYLYTTSFIKSAVIHFCMDIICFAAI